MRGEKKFALTAKGYWPFIMSAHLLIHKMTLIYKTALINETVLRKKAVLINQVISVALVSIIQAF